MFSNVDVFIISRELDQILKNSIIHNVYEIEDLLLFKIRTEEGKQNLIIKSDERINITNYDYPIPPYPSQYITSLRKLLKNRRILNVSQYNFDRILIFELSHEEKSWKFIIELFNKGNFLLVDENNILKVAKKYKIFKDRTILAGKEYVFPQSRGINFLTITQEEFKQLIINSDIEVVREIARNINIAGIFSEELCYRANINKNSIGKDLTEKDLDTLFINFKNLRNEIIFGKINAHILIDNNNNKEIQALPFELSMFSNSNKIYFNSFNNAVDTFYSKIDSETILKPKGENIDKKIKDQKNILKTQLDYIEELKRKKDVYYKKGNFVYSNFKSFENLINVINQARSKGYSYDEINNRLKEAKTKIVEGTEFFDKIDPVNKQIIIIKENEEELHLDLKKTIGENANLIYEKGKKADKKIKGTLTAIEETKSNLKKLKQEKKEKETGVGFLIKKPKKKWYEKFRWFISSDGFLVIGGRDASSNEIIFKKYIEQNDLVFHTNFPGSPLAILKNTENKEISESAINEVADFVVSYSRAWKEAWGVAEVFFVNPTQISKTPPSGEYIQKGSFMISGKKNFIKNAKTELAITLKFIELENDLNNIEKGYYPKIFCGPVNAIKAHFTNYIIITPSKEGLSIGDLAKELKYQFLNAFNEGLKKWINLLPLDDIILILPSGLSKIYQII